MEGRADPGLAAVGAGDKGTCAAFDECGAGPAALDFIGLPVPADQEVLMAMGPGSFCLRGEAGADETASAAALPLGSSCSRASCDSLDTMPAAGATLRGDGGASQLARRVSMGGLGATLAAGVVPGWE